MQNMLDKFITTGNFLKYLYRKPKVIYHSNDLGGWTILMVNKNYKLLRIYNLPQQNTVYYKLSDDLL